MGFWIVVAVACVVISLLAAGLVGLWFAMINLVENDWRK